MDRATLLSGYVITRTKPTERGPVEVPIVATFAPTENQSWRIARGLVAKNHPSMARAPIRINDMKQQGFAARKCRMTWEIN